MFYSVWSSFFPIILLFFYSTSEARSLSKRGLTPSVVGHFMVGNTYPYTKWDWIRGTRLFLTLFASNMRRKDIRQASSKGLDAFALNLGVDSWQPDRIADAFEAADICSSTYGITFKLFLSFDMTSLPCSDPGHAQLLQQYVNQYSQRASYFQYDSLPVVSTFAGERCSFGQSNLNDAWNFAIKSPFPASRFIPSFFVDPSQFSSLPVMDGAFNVSSSTVSLAARTDIPCSGTLAGLKKTTISISTETTNTFLNSVVVYTWPLSPHGSSQFVDSSSADIT